MGPARSLVVVAVALVAAACGGGHKALPTPTAPPRAEKTATAGPRVRKPRPVLAVAPVFTRGAASRRAAIPILTYHVVSAAPSGAAYPQLWVSPDRFAGEMAALQRAGYHAITLEAAYRAWTAGGPLPRKPVVLSFDDGYASHYTHARPVLRRYRWPGVLNLVLHNLGPKGITERQVRGLIAAGWEIDSHTVTHPDLTTLPADQLRRELVDSRNTIKRRFGQPVRFFCYPSGRYNDAVVAAVKAAGYRLATTEDEGYGVAADALVLKRVRVNGSDTPAGLLARLRQEAS